MDEDQQLPSLAILLAQVAAERETMNAHAATLVRQKGWRVRAAVGCLATAAVLVVVGMLTAMGGRLHA